MHALTMTRAAIFLVAFGGVACQGADSDSPDAREAANTEVAPAADLEIQAIVDVSVHESWAKVSEARGARWSSPKNDVQLFFGPIRSVDEPRAVIEGLAVQWGVSDIQWGEEQKIAVGAERLPALAADGACKTRAGDATIAYATADAGRGTVLLAYVFDKGASPEAREVAMKAVGSFTKK